MFDSFRPFSNQKLEVKLVKDESLKPAPAARDSAKTSPDEWASAAQSVIKTYFLCRVGHEVVKKILK